MTSESRQKIGYKFKTFEPDFDMNNPVFKLGMKFSNVKELRKALAFYTVRNRVKIVKTRNTASILNARCDGKLGKQKCTWFFRASEDSREHCMVIKKFCGVHICSRQWNVKALAAPFLTQKFIDEFRDDEKMSLKSFATKVRKEFNMVSKRWKLGRARKAALTIIHGDEEA
jgi:hypothetical protein